ncbi:hypothetical protein Pfo_010171 [Paulownia fortunei]|nr:hypothetical protein Pfo_010171 [Paulownia fortunei]
MSLLVYLVLYLYLHACSARPLMASDKETLPQLQLSAGKDVKSSVAKGFIRQANFRVEHGEKTSDDADALQLDTQKASAVKQSEGIKGNKVKLSYSWKILQKAAERQVWRRVERLTLESPPSNAEETVKSKESDTVEDIFVMDYEQPHRKPPIHNRGT